MTTPQTSPSATLGIGLIWSHKLSILACGLVGVALGFIYLEVVPPTYQAQARVLVEPQGITPEIDNQNRTLPEFLPTQAETIRSPITIARALETINVALPPDAKPETFDAVRHVMKSLQATPVLNANVLTISYQSTDPEEAVNLISAVIASYRENVAEVDKGTWGMNVQVIAARERELRKDLEKLQAQYAEHRSESPLVTDGRDGAGVALTQLNELSSHLAATQRRRLDLEARLSSLTTAVAALDDKPIVKEVSNSTSTGRTKLANLERKPQTIDTSIIDQVINYSEPDDARKIEELAANLRFGKLRVQQYDAIYGDKHPDMINARAEVAEQELSLQERLRNVASTWRSELNTLADTEQRLRESYQAERLLVKEVDGYLVADQTLQGNIRKVEELHSATLAQLMSIQSADKALLEGRHSIEVRIMDPPRLLDQMAWPKPKPLLASSAILGLLAGMGMVWLRALSRQS